MAGTLGALVLAVDCLGRSRVEDFVREWASWCNRLFLFFFFLARWADLGRGAALRPCGRPRGGRADGWRVGMLGGDS
jgi:hypothetical protein